MHQWTNINFEPSKLVVGQAPCYEASFAVSCFLPLNSGGLQLILYFQTRTLVLQLNYLSIFFNFRSYFFYIVFLVFSWAIHVSLEDWSLNDYEYFQMITFICTFLYSGIIKKNNIIFSVVALLITKIKNNNIIPPY